MPERASSGFSFRPHQNSPSFVISQIKTQLTLDLDKSPSHLPRLLDCLGKEKINPKTLVTSPAEADQRYRFLAEDPDRTAAALRSEGFQVSLESVLAIARSESKGQLAQLTRTLSAVGIKIDYLYYSSGEAQPSELVLKASNLRLAAAVLEEVLAAA